MSNNASFLSSTYLLDENTVAFTMITELLLRLTLHIYELLL
ncbi:hypothetical protein [Pedobacter changchengzhani]|nr:hypothetical protein [Pedobacter changchengzhani]